MPRSSPIIEGIGAGEAKLDTGLKPVFTLRSHGTWPRFWSTTEVPAPVIRASRGQDVEAIFLKDGHQQHERTNTLKPSLSSFQVNLLPKLLREGELHFSPFPGNRDTSWDQMRAALCMYANESSPNAATSRHCDMELSFTRVTLRTALPTCKKYCKRNTP